MIRTKTGDGATLAGRPELGTILDFIHPGETWWLRASTAWRARCAISRS